MGIKTTTLFVLAVLSAASAFYELVPEGKELTYDYKALVKAGTHYPEDFASEFYLHGKLHVKTDGHVAYMKFTDMVYKMYNGKVDHDFEAHEVPVGEEVKDLYKPFKITYDETGKVKSFTTYKIEKPYTVNMKKAVATIFQMDYTKVMSTTKKHAFISDELSLYGTDQTHYNVFTATDGMVTVERFHDMVEAHHIYEHMVSNKQINMGACQEHFEEPMAHDSMKVYTLKKHDGHYIADHITTRGGLYVHPLKAESETYHLYSNTTFDLISVTPITTNFDVTEEHTFTTLEFMPFEADVEYESIPDMTGGRRTIDMKKLETAAEKMLKETVEYLEHHHIHSKTPDIKNGQLINRLHRAMAHMDFKTIQHLWTTFSEKTDKEGKMMFEIYEEMLPVVATRACIMQIIYLVGNNKVKDTVALELLRELPFNVKVPTTKLMKDMEAFLHFDETKVSWAVRKSAMMAFASFVHKHYEFDRKYNKEHTNTFEKEYVTFFMDKFKTAKTYDEKMAYLSCIYNMEAQASIPHLKKIINGEMEQNEHIRLMAMWALYPSILGNPDAIYETYWPIMTDWHEPTHNRIMAYYMIMLSQPSLSRMINIYWHMQQETNHEVYQFYYKYLHKLANTYNTCKSKSKLHAQQILKYTHPPNFYGLTGYYGWDYTDDQFGFGRGSESFLVIDKNSALMMAMDSLNFFNAPMLPHGLLVKVHGIEGIEEIGLNTIADTNTLFSTKQLVEYFSHLKNAKDLHIEIVLFHNQRVFNSLFINLDNIHEAPYMLASLGKDFHTKEHTLEIKSKMYTKIFMPTQIGFLAASEWIIPETTYTTWDLKKETIKDVTTWHMDTTQRIWSHGRYGLSFYNPVADVWQGVNRYNTFDAHFPYFFDMTINGDFESLKLSFKKHGDDEKDTFGYRSHVTTMTFVKDDYHHGALTKSTPKAHEFTIVTKGDEYRHEHTPTHDTSYFNGYDHMVTIYDSERLYTNSSMKHLGHLLVFPDDIFDSDDFLAAYAQKWDYTYMQPWPGTNGILEKWVPSKTSPVTTFDISLRSHYDIIRGEIPLLPGIKWNSKMTLTSYHDTKALKTWDVHTLFDIKPGHMTQSMKMQLQRVISGGGQFKYCIEGMKKYTSDHVTGYLTVSEKDGPAEEKCTEEDMILEVKMTGVKSEEQLSEFPVYGECDEHVTAMGAFHHKLLPCYLAFDTFRNYTYDVHTSKTMKNEYKQSLLALWDAFKGYFYENYEFVDEHEEEIKEHHTKVQILYPLYGKTFNMYVTTPNYAYHFEEMEDPQTQWMYFHPDTIHYTTMYKFMHRMGMTNYCSLYNDTIHFKYDAIPYHLPNEWTMIVGDKETDPTYAVYAKEVEGAHHMALKLVHKTHTLIITPTTEYHYDITLDGTKMEKDHYSGEWFFYQQQPHTDFMGIIGYHLGVHMFYDGTHVHMDVPKIDVPYYGQCFKKH